MVSLAKCGRVALIMPGESDSSRVRRIALRGSRGFRVRPVQTCLARGRDATLFTATLLSVTVVECRDRFLPSGETGLPAVWPLRWSEERLTVTRASDPTGVVKSDTARGNALSDPGKHIPRLERVGGLVHRRYQGSRRGGIPHRQSGVSPPGQDGDDLPPNACASTYRQGVRKFINATIAGRFLAPLF